ncbi:Cof-type HAD-IIB family hydrolase [Paenibacillus spongiae]|uniref:Cof-type HAD-IIB family hydrolase n=1 Tax=Paenibacillus spongiae TaxID=2909671 RepID=A0ABY5SCL5_9BACL|nr:Cof-type HAD-IIB family hydrolase [Paenibacillus spongiae]UVI31265.1 Cof-type HAD-IIB family hydrolase [Paenibacillus spongiae]
MNTFAAIAERVRGFVFDLDGTLLNSDAVISAANRSALLKLKQAGMKLIIATGRNLSEARAVCGDLPFDGYVCSNGMSVYGHDFAIMHSEAIPSEIAGQLLTELRRSKANYELHASDNGIVIVQEDMPFLRLRLPDIKALPERLVRDGLSQGTMQLFKLMVVEEDITAIYEQMKAMEQLVEVIRMNDNSIELNKKGVSKWSGLQIQFAKLGIGGDEVIAFGDSMNDWMMLSSSGWSVAMGNADPHIQAIARDRTVSNDKDGVAAYVQKLGLTSGAKEKEMKSS